jgi:hypothetical protein
VGSQCHPKIAAKVFAYVKQNKRALLKEVEWERIIQMQPCKLMKALNYVLIHLVDHSKGSINFGKGPILLSDHVHAITNLPKGGIRVIETNDPQYDPADEDMKQLYEDLPDTLLILEDQVCT